MKVSQEHYASLEEEIVPLNTRERRERYRRRDIPRSAFVRDLDLRYRWDLFYDAGGFRLIGTGNYDSDHIDTALRRIVPVLGEHECPLCNSAAYLCDETHTDNVSGPRLHCRSASMHNFTLVDGDWQLI